MRLLLIAAFAALLVWPAAFNRYLFMSPDALSYVSQDRFAWHMLLHLHDTAMSRGTRQFELTASMESGVQ